MLCLTSVVLQGWRLDPLLLFGQLLTAGAALSFGVEALRLREIVYKKEVALVHSMLVLTCCMHLPLTIHLQFCSRVQRVKLNNYLAESSLSSCSCRKPVLMMHKQQSLVKVPGIQRPCPCPSPGISHRPHQHLQHPHLKLPDRGGR